MSEHERDLVVCGDTDRTIAQDSIAATCHRCGRAIVVSPRLEVEHPNAELICVPCCAVLVSKMRTMPEFRAGAYALEELRENGVDAEEVVRAFNQKMRRLSS